MDICPGRTRPSRVESHWLVEGSRPVITSPPAAAGEALTIIAMTGCVGIRLEGDIDLATAATLEAALDELMGATGDVHLDLAELNFVDLSGVAVLVAAATRLAPDRSLVVHDPPPTLNRIVETFWEGVARIRVRVDVT